MSEYTPMGQIANGPTQAHPKTLAHIPILATWHGDPWESVTNVPTVQGVVDICKANTYKQFPVWQTFTGLFLTGQMNNLVSFI